MVKIGEGGGFEGYTTKGGEKNTSSDRCGRLIGEEIG